MTVEQLQQATGTVRFRVHIPDGPAPAFPHPKAGSPCRDAGGLLEACAGRDAGHFGEPACHAGAAGVSPSTSSSSGVERAVGLRSEEVVVGLPGGAVEGTDGPLDTGRIVVNLRLLFNVPAGMDPNAMFGHVFGAVMEALPDTAAGAARVSAEGTAVVVEVPRAC